MEGRVDYTDVNLCAWFPNLDLQDEKIIHSNLKQVYPSKGEWYRVKNPKEVAMLIQDWGGIREYVTRKDLKWTLIANGIPLDVMDSILD